MPKHLGATTPVFPQDLFNHNQLMMVDFSPSPVMFFRWWGVFPVRGWGSSKGGHGPILHPGCTCGQ